MKRSRLRRVSAKRRAEKELRQLALSEVTMRDGPWCFADTLIPEIRCGGVIDGHELLPRGQGGSITDPDNIKLCCRAHHDWIHEHPKISYARGLLKHRWTDNEIENEPENAVPLGERVQDEETDLSSL